MRVLLFSMNDPRAFQRQTSLRRPRFYYDFTLCQFFSANTGSPLRLHISITAPVTRGPYIPSYPSWVATAIRGSSDLISCPPAAARVATDPHQEPNLPAVVQQMRFPGAFNTSSIFLTLSLEPPEFPDDLNTTSTFFTDLLQPPEPPEASIIFNHAIEFVRSWLSC